MPPSPVVPRPTVFVISPRLSAHAGPGLAITLATETFQYTGSFKFRGAFNTVAHTSAAHLIAASSGNFGQALAFACRLHGKRCTIVMPHDSPTVKVEAVHAYGATVDFIETRLKPRAVRVAELLAEHSDVVEAYPSDGEPMLAGNETLGAEILAHEPAFDTIVAPVGGGGVIVGLIRAARRLRRDVTLLAAEPVVANDVAQSFRAGTRVALAAEPATLADGVRVLSVSAANWEVIRDGCHGVIEVEESAIAEATRYLFTLANLKAEPTGALALAAVLTRREQFEGKRVCCVVTGGNVDPVVYARLLQGNAAG
jgi:threo-3-hydroxy-L-aspartate ammonia-lyase